MNISRILQISTDSSEATELLAEKIGRNLKGGEVIELASDLGGGKTTFVRGLARGAGSKDHVSSPTFKLCNEYEIRHDKPEMFKPERIYHYDFYRLPDSGLMGAELHDALQDDNGVVVVEWGKVAANVLPVDRLKIRIHKLADEKRAIVIDVPQKLAYVVEQMT